MTFARYDPSKFPKRSYKGFRIGPLRRRRDGFSAKTPVFFLFFPEKSEKLKKSSWTESVDDVGRREISDFSGKKGKKSEKSRKREKNLKKPKNWGKNQSLFLGRAKTRTLIDRFVPVVRLMLSAFRPLRPSGPPDFYLI